MPEQSEDTNTFLSYRPGRMVRWGITSMLFVLMLAVGVSWFVQYPDLVVCKAKLTGSHTPQPVIARTDGRLLTLNVQEGESVRHGAILGTIESLAEADRVLCLQKMTDTINVYLLNEQWGQAAAYYPRLHYFALTEQGLLGELQHAFHSFMQLYINFGNYSGSGFYSQKRGMLKRDIGHLVHQEKWLYKQTLLAERDIALASENFAAQQKLASDKVIAPLEYRLEESKLLSKQMILPQLYTGIGENQNRQWEKQKEAIQLSAETQMQVRQFAQALQVLRAAIRQWMQTYLLISPASGVFSCSGYFQPGQLVRSGETIGRVHTQHSLYHAEVWVPQYNFGKVKIGQKVLIKLLAYPHEQFGMVEGTVHHILTTGTDSGFLAKIALPSGLTSQYGDTLNYHEGLTGQADIITENMNLLQRFYFNSIKAIRR